MSQSSPPLVHAVYFTLKERTAQAREELIAACRKYLADHPGTTHFSAGPRAEECQRPVNDVEFDVALLLVFESLADHDRYQSSERHQAFLNDHLGNCSKVRVFDSLGQ